jgi:two-component system, chemotaxis family, protein-glutamate methylesterase/glutaminase
MIRVLVAEDSVTFRLMLVEMLRSDPDIEVVGEASNGQEAIELTRRHRPDVVTMDIHMPVLDGFEATKQIMIHTPTPIVIVSGSLDPHDVEFSMYALRAGALALLPKPRGLASGDFDRMVKRFTETIKAMSQVKVVRHWAPRQPMVAEAPPAVPVREIRVQVLAIAASTGGPTALNRLFSSLRGDLNVPVLVVQHMVPEFIGGLASWLNLSAALKVKVAEDAEPLLPGVAYLAPDNQHLGVSASHAIQLSSDPPMDGFRPSGTFLFASVARIYGPAAAALILTGMGRDGVEGLRMLHNAGGHVIAQDEKTSVVFGMPGEAIASGCTHSVLPLFQIPGYLSQLLNNRSQRQ